MTLRAFHDFKLALRAEYTSLEMHRYSHLSNGVEERLLRLMIEYVGVALRGQRENGVVRCPRPRVPWGVVH